MSFCEKIEQTIYLQIYTLLRKKLPKNLGHYCDFQSTAQSGKQLLNMLKSPNRGPML
jgi:hypothetical protein